MKQKYQVITALRGCVYTKQWPLTVGLSWKVGTDSRGTATFSDLDYTWWCTKLTSKQFQLVCIFHRLLTCCRGKVQGCSLLRGSPHHSIAKVDGLCRKCGHKWSSEGKCEHKGSGKFLKNYVVRDTNFCRCSVGQKDYLSRCFISFWFLKWNLPGVKIASILFYLWPEYVVPQGPLFQNYLTATVWVKQDFVLLKLF